MFSKQSAVFGKLVRAGLPEAITTVFQSIFADPTIPLEHRAPITIRVTQGQPSQTAANRAAVAPPTDAQKGAPALTLMNYGGRALHTQAGHVVFDPANKTDPNFIGNPAVPVLGPADAFRVNIPSVYNHYVWHQFPVCFNDDIRMGVPPGKDALIMKYATPSYGSSIRRFKLKADMAAGKALAVPIDWRGIQCGNPFLVYDAGGATGQFQCAKNGAFGFAIYFSDGTDLGTPDGFTAAAKDNRYRPNLGNWQVLTVDNGSNDTITIKIPSRICCIASRVVLCTQTLTLRLCPGVVGGLGALDCGGTAQCS
jgi:hypothetical protein